MEPLRRLVQPRHPSVSRRSFLTGLAGTAGIVGLAACSGIARDGAGATGAPGAAAGEAADGPTASATPATSAQIAARAVVPVLCYHQVREWTNEDSEYTRNVLVIPPAKLGEQLDTIATAGYTAISPDQYYAHLTTGAEMPAKSVMLAFDDGKDNQATTALAALTERGMHATFFIMTVVIGNPGWVSKDDIKRVADAGMTIGSHTWDHHRVDEYTDEHLEPQLMKPMETLRAASGQPVLDFAYPHGAWDADGARLVAEAGYRTGYQLSDQPVSSEQPLYSLRRVLAGSTWSAEEVVATLDGFANAGP